MRLNQNICKVLGTVCLCVCVCVCVCVTNVIGTDTRSLCYLMLCLYVNWRDIYAKLPLGITLIIFLIHSCNYVSVTNIFMFLQYDFLFYSGFRKVHQTPCCFNGKIWECICATKPYSSNLTVKTTRCLTHLTLEFALILYVLCLVWIIFLLKNVTCTNFCSPRRCCLLLFGRFAWLIAYLTFDWECIGKDNKKAE